MPRTARASLGNWCYHVLNRGNARGEVFHKDEDYAAFIGLFEPACERLHMRILGYCLMPNHFHLVLRPFADGDLGRWMQWKRGHSTFFLPSRPSLRARLAPGGSELLWSPPVTLPRNWKSAVNEPQTEAEVAATRRSIQRGTPFGSETWTKRAARQLGLESTLRPRGRPRKDAKK